MAVPDWAVARFRSAPVAMLGTVRPDGSPHVVPVVFAMAGTDGPGTDDADCQATAYTAVDGKPKSGRRLQRLANIEHNPAVSLLVQHYDDDWSALWWVRADGVARIHRGDDACETGLAALRRKYPQYRDVGLDGPVVAVRIGRWSGWQAIPPG